MKAGRWIGVIIVLAAAFFAAWWIGGPEGDREPLPPPRQARSAPPKERPEAEPPPKREPRPRSEAAPEPVAERPAEGEARPEGDGEGSYNEAMLPPPSPSYQDDPKRFGKTYQKQAELAAPYWDELADALKEEPQLASQARRLSESLKDPQADPLETTHEALLLENRIREGAELGPRGQEVLDYLNQVTSTVIQDGDPSAIARPR